MESLIELLANLFINPWKFWATILGSFVGIAFLGYLFIVCSVIGAFLFLDLFKAIAVTIAILFWVGPVLFFTPITMMFIVPNMLAGDFTITVGCGRRKDGSLICL